jgi:hypothetical protein
VIYALITVGVFVGLIVLLLNLMATVSLVRTSALTRFQKIAQATLAEGRRVDRMAGSEIGEPVAAARETDEGSVHRTSGRNSTRCRLTAREPNPC